MRVVGEGVDGRAPKRAVRWWVRKPVGSKKAHILKTAKRKSTESGEEGNPLQRKHESVEETQCELFDGRRAAKVRGGSQSWKVKKSVRIKE